MKGKTTGSYPVTCRYVPLRCRRSSDEKEDDKHFAELMGALSACGMADGIVKSLLEVLSGLLSLSRMVFVEVRVWVTVGDDG